MKKSYTVAAMVLSVFLFIGCNGTTTVSDADNVIELTSQEVECACGACKFGMDGTSCDLAIRHDGKTYYVDGSNIDDHGDAHSEKDGMCYVVRKATVTGKIENGRFVSTQFDVHPFAGADDQAVEKNSAEEKSNDDQSDKEEADNKPEDSKSENENDSEDNNESEAGDESKENADDSKAENDDSGSGDDETN